MGSMHETGIVRDLVRRIAAAAQNAGADRVSGVVLWIGALSQFAPAHFREHFDEEARGTIAEGAALTIEMSEDLAHPHAQDVMMQSVNLDVPDRRT